MTRTAAIDKILLIGAFDTKGAEYAHLRECLVRAGASLVTANIGVLGTTDRFPVDVEADRFAAAAGTDLDALRRASDRGHAMTAMARGAAVLARQMFDRGDFRAAIGMGGSAGTTVVTAALRSLPLGTPKVCITTMSNADTRCFVQLSDIVLIPAITDISGLNRISRRVMSQAAGALLGMVDAPAAAPEPERPVIVASMFGNTTECVNACRERLENEGYEVIVFHATGSGGRMMEALIADGLVDACLDVTTTEWADELCGGIFSAGPDRLAAAGAIGIPHLIAPGCVDMVNFGPLDTVPQPYRDSGRTLHVWNPSVTLMRTNCEENARIGNVFAQKANAARGPVAFLLPSSGVSILDGDGQPFEDRAADRALFDSIRQHVEPHIPVETIACNINDPPFAERAVTMLLAMLRQTRPPD